MIGITSIVRRRDGSFFMPEYLAELVEAVGRERLTVSAVFAMHTGVTPWSAIEAAVAKANAAG